MPEAPTQKPVADPPAEREPGPQRAAVEAVAAAGNDAKAKVLQEEIGPSEAMDATEFFLNPNPEEEVAEKTIKLRVGRPGTDREWAYWTIRAMDRERIQQIREQHRRPGGRRGRGAETTDEMASNLRIAVEGTAVPDLTDPEVRGRYADPADALAARFKFKPGLIDQIAAEVIAFSGYDDEDVDEVTAVKT